MTEVEKIRIDAQEYLRDTLHMNTQAVDRTLASIDVASTAMGFVCDSIGFIGLSLVCIMAIAMWDEEMIHNPILDTEDRLPDELREIVHQLHQKALLSDI